MDTKKCGCCKKELTKDNFTKNKVKKDGLQVQCKSCQNTRARNNYPKYKEQTIIRNRRLRREKRSWFHVYKDTLSCERCGENHEACMDFHHLDPSTKEFRLSNFHNYSKVRIKKEIEKCIILCANCHRKEHYIKYKLPQ